MLSTLQSKRLHNFAEIKKKEKKKKPASNQKAQAETIDDETLFANWITFRDRAVSTNLAQFYF